MNISRWLLTLGLALLVSACSGKDEAAPTTEVASTATATMEAATPPANTPTPSATQIPRAGVAIVDRFIGAMLTADATELPALVDYHDVACEVSPMGIGAPPPCPPGVPDGTPIRLISGSSCEGYFITAPEAGEQLMSAAQRGVSVFSASRLPGGGYAVILTPPGGGTSQSAAQAIMGAVYRLSERGVVSIAHPCGPSARTTSLQYPDYLIQPPPLPAVPAATQHTGIAGVDAIIDAVVVRDIATLLARTKQVEVGCGSDRWLPYCGDQPAGTLIETTEIRQCGDQLWFTRDGMLYDIDYQIGPSPTIFAVTRRAEGGYAVVVDARGDPAQRDGGHAIVVSPEGEILVFDRGCQQSPQELAATYTDFVIAPK
ncbi:MAG: hypothetical protein ABI577_13495 [bacterium]